MKTCCKNKVINVNGAWKRPWNQNEEICFMSNKKTEARDNQRAHSEKHPKSEAPEGKMNHTPTCGPTRLHLITKLNQYLRITTYKKKCDIT
jgi:hypothetical protein